MSRYRSTDGFEENRFIEQINNGGAQPEELEPLTFAQFSAMNRARCESPQGFNHALASWSNSDWFVAFIGEAGEAANKLKKLNRIRDGVPGNEPHETEEYLRAGMRKEIADAFVYLDLLAQAGGFNLEDAVREKFNATSQKIGYPELL